MTPEQASILDYTVSHFQEVARQNRFPENSTVAHDTDRCAVCHAELVPLHPFATYLEVVVQSVKVRRPRLDQGLVDEINGDLALMEIPERVSLDELLARDERAVPRWKDWLRDAVSTGLGLLSVHSATSREFTLEEAEEDGMGELIESKIEELMASQLKGTSG